VATDLGLLPNGSYATAQIFYCGIEER